MSPDAALTADPLEPPSGSAADVTSPLVGPKRATSYGCSLWEVGVQAT